MMSKSCVMSESEDIQRKGKTAENESCFIPVVTVFDWEILIPTDDSESSVHPSSAFYYLV